MPIEFAVAELPTAAMHADQDRRFALPFWQIKVAEQLFAIVLGKHDVRFDYDLVLRCHRKPLDH